MSNWSRACQLISKGCQLSKENDFKGALAAAEEAIQLAPHMAEAYYNKGVYLNTLGHKEEAIVAYDAAIAIRPTYAGAFTNKGESLFDLGRLKEALAAYEQTITLNPQDKFAYGNKGFILYKLGQLDEAIKYYDKQLEADPDCFITYAKKGKALSDLNKTHEATKCFQTSIQKMAQGKLTGQRFYYSTGHVAVLNKSELQLVENIKSLLDLPTLKIDETQSQGLNDTIQKMNTKKDNLKIKVITTIVDAMGQESSKKDELNALQKELVDLKEKYEQIAKDLSQVKADIQDSGMKELAEVKRAYKALEDQDEELLVYCKTFYWTAINLFSAYRAASTGLFQGNFDAEGGAKEDLLVKGVKKATSIASDVASGVPFVGGILSLLDTVIDGIYAAVKENRFNNKVNAINKIIQTKFGTDDDISLCLSKVALAITRAKEQAILYPDIEVLTTPKVEAGLKWLSSKVDAIKDKVLPSINIHDKNSHGATLALKDVALFLAFLWKNHETVIKRKEPLDKQIESIVKYGGLDKLLECLEETDNKETRKQVEGVQNADRSSCCQLF